MAITYVNTTELDDIAEKLSSLSNDYLNEINNLFNRLSEVPSETTEWTGTQSKKYLNIILRDKMEYLEVGNKMKYIADELKRNSIDINNCVNYCNENEAKKGY